MGEEADLDEAVIKIAKSSRCLSKKMGASDATGAKGKIIPNVSMNGDTTMLVTQILKVKEHTIYTIKEKDYLKHNQTR